MQKWKLFAPKDLSALINKGVTDFVQFVRITLGRQAQELKFVRDTFEKVCRLADVLQFLNRMICSLKHWH